MYFNNHVKSNGRKGFTLLELLIVIGILAILATVVVLIINPAEYLKQARDVKRLDNLNSLDKTLSLANLEGINLGNSNVIYISIPDDNSSSCLSLGLPVAPSGYSYSCSNSQNVNKVDGTGWIPVNFTQIAAGSPISVLPVDPVNTTSSSLFYAYTPGTQYELSAYTESEKYLTKGSNDGGDSIAYESGSNLKLSPIKKTTFDFSSFTTTTQAGVAGWYKSVAGNGILGSDVDGSYLEANGVYVWYQWNENIPYNPNKEYKISCKVRQVTDPTSGGKGIYCGVAGVAADGVTYLNIIGANNSGSQHYFAAGGHTLTAGAGYTTFSGYFKGTGSTGAGGYHPNENSPGWMYPGTTYIRPMFILNYANGNGIADISMELLEVVK